MVEQQRMPLAAAISDVFLNHYKKPREFENETPKKTKSTTTTTHSSDFGLIVYTRSGSQTSTTQSPVSASNCSVVFGNYSRKSSVEDHNRLRVGGSRSPDHSQKLGLLHDAIPNSKVEDRPHRPPKVSSLMGY